VNLKTFNIELTASLAGYCAAQPSHMSDELLKRFERVISDYCIDRAIAYGQTVVKVVSSEGSESTSYRHEPAVTE
jgi:hypothetical protein